MAKASRPARDKARSPARTLQAESIHARFPEWMSATYHVLHLLELLEVFTQVPCSLAPVLPGSYWIVIQRTPQSVGRLMAWETRLGQHEARHRYNAGHLQRIAQTLTSEVGTFGGFSDVFVPVIHRGRCEAALVAGPLVTRTLESADILKQWTDLGGTPANPYHPGLSDYARSALAVQELDTAEIGALREVLEALARAFVGSSDVLPEIERMAELRRTVLGRMPAAREWKAARMIDPFAEGGWNGKLSDDEQFELGIEHIPNTVIALMPDEIESTRDVVSKLTQAHGFQRRAAELSRRTPGTLCVPLADYGVYLLFHHPTRRGAAPGRGAAVVRARALAELVERETGRRVSLGVGGTVESPADLGECARRATVALQLAAHSSIRMLVFDETLERDTAGGGARKTARGLAALVQAFAGAKLAEFDALQAAYVRQVLLDSGGRATRIRLHLEYALDALLSKLEAGVEIDARTLNDLEERSYEALERAASSAALVSAFRDATALLVRASGSPSDGQLELKLTRAARYIEEHCAEALTLQAVARKAGLSRTYFSQQFKTRFGFGFADHLRNARVERAKHLLRHSELSIQQVSQSSGFVSVPHFHRVFRDAVNVTPSLYRSENRPQKA